MMGRKAEPKVPIAVSKLNFPGLYFVGHVTGLALNVSKTSSKSWILRATIGGRRRDMGLGPFPEVSLAQAKLIASEKRQLIRDGIDPIEQRKENREALRTSQKKQVTFEEASKRYIDSHKAAWKNAKHIAQWSSSLDKYANPIIGKLYVKDISLEHIMEILEPIWYSKTETATRVRSRIELILAWAKTHKFRSGDNPAQWKGNLAALLPSANKVSTVKHFAAMDFHDCPKFMRELNKLNSNSADALKLCILTATRSNEVRNCVWPELNLERGIWTIPAERMKAKKEHRIPLSPQVLQFLKGLPKADNGLVFPSTENTALGDMALSMALRGITENCTVHGFRSTFRDWAGETTSFPREVIEHALAHQLKDKAEAAYARGDLFTKRKKLMATWSNYLLGKKAA